MKSQKSKGTKEFKNISEVHKYYFPNSSNPKPEEEKNKESFGTYIAMDILKNIQKQISK
jgi:hypothetical protein